MNAYYNKESRIDSNNDIFEAYFQTGVRRASGGQKILERLLAFVLAMVAVITGAKARRLLAVTAVALALVGMVGLIGAMESGALGIGTGFLIGAILLVIEVFALRRH